MWRYGQFVCKNKQQSRLIAMMSDYDRTMELTQISMESEGATAAQLEQYMSSLTAATNRLTTSWQGLVQSFINSDAVIWVIDALASFVGWLSEGYNWLWAVIPAMLILIIHLGSTVAAYILTAVAAKKAGDAAEKAGNKAAIAWLKALGPIGIAAAALIGIVALVVHGIASMESQAKKSAKKIAELQNEIYNIKKASTAIDSAISKFDNLDSKVIKTKEDIEAMNEALTSVRDTLSDEIIEKYYTEGSVEQFRMLEGVELKAALEEIQEELQKAEIKRRQKLVRELRQNGSSLSDAYRNMVAKGDGASAKAGIASAVAMELMPLNYSVEDRAIIDSKLNLLDYKGMAELLDSGQMKQFAKDTLAINEAMEEVLSKGTMSEQAAAFEKLKSTYGDNNKALEALVKEYPQLKAFLAMQKSRVLANIESYGMGINEVNDFTEAIQDLNEKYNKNIEWQLVIERLANGESFESIARSFNLTGEAAKDFYNALDRASSDSALSISQDADKLMNGISSVWEMQEKVLSGQASESEITEFFNNHLELTQDEGFADAFFGGEDLTPFLETLYSEDLHKLQTSIDKQIASAIAQGDAARVKQLEKIQGKIRKLIQNDPTIDEIVAQQDALEEKFTEISDKRIEELEKEKDKELELLDEKRKAYEDYYDSLEEMSEIEDYEEERQKIVNQLNKLSASSDAASMNKALELEKKLAELDKDHQKTLKEQAKEAMLKSFDTQEEELESKYEKLIEAVPESVKQGIETNQQAFEQYAKFLATTGITQEKFLVEMRDFAESLGITNFGKILQGLEGIQSDLKTSITNNNTANVTVNTSTNGDSFSNSLVKLLQQYGLIVT